MSDSTSPSSQKPKIPAQPKPLANSFLGKRDHDNGGMVYSTESKTSHRMILGSRILLARLFKQENPNTPTLVDPDKNAAPQQA